MAAYVIHPDRLGEPRHALVLEQVDVPEPGPGEVLVRVMAAGVNYNGVWASLGQPVPVFRFHGEATHVPGSELAGVVERVGPGVTLWRAGDEVVANPAQTCGECPACNGFDPLACERLRAWGYETTPGCFAEYALVQARQLLRKPQRLGWTDAAGSGAIFIVYRMLVTRAGLRPGQIVLVWGGAGGLGSMAVQLCRAAGAVAIAVVSSDEKADLCRRLGAAGIVDRREFRLDGRVGDASAELRRFGARIRELTGGDDPDIVFEHVGAATFAASLFVCKRFGTIVTCGATTGYALPFDARLLWTRQKSVVGSHISTLHDAEQGNRLLEAGAVRPVVSRVYPFAELPEAHQAMYENRHVGKLVVSVGADGDAGGAGAGDGGPARLPAP